jgi:hypothetical protein
MSPQVDHVARAEAPSRPGPASCRYGNAAHLLLAPEREGIASRKTS